MTASEPTGEDPFEAARRQRSELRECILDLERALAAPSPRRVEEWAKQVRHSVEFLRVSFRDHLRVTEGENGLYEDIQTIDPRLSSRITILLREHEEIGAALADLNDVTETASADDPVAWVENVRDRATAVVSMLVKHRQRGADLVYEAYDADIGGES